MRQPGFVLFKMREGPCWAPQQGPALVHGGPNKQKRGPALRLKLIDLHRPRNPRLLMSCRARHVLGHQRGRERGPATARRGGQVHQARQNGKGDDKFGDKKIAKKCVKKSVEIRGGFLDREMSVIFFVFSFVGDSRPLQSAAARRHFGSAAREFLACFRGRWAGARARQLRCRRRA